MTRNIRRLKQKVFNTIALLCFMELERKVLYLYIV